jgi:hypothetical protein
MASTKWTICTADERSLHFIEGLSRKQDWSNAYFKQLSETHGARVRQRSKQVLATDTLEPNILRWGFV